jgi:alpha-galactosidase
VVRSYRWDFGDGVTIEGADVNHAYTEPGEYNVHLKATGLSGLTVEDHFQVRISGHMPTIFDPQNNKRYQPAK